jgi:hypothetical protein
MKEQWVLCAPFQIASIINEVIKTWSSDLEPRTDGLLWVILTLFSLASSATEHKPQHCQQNGFNTAMWEGGKAMGTKEL